MNNSIASLLRSDSGIVASAAIFFVLSSPMARAATWTIDPNTSVFAVITHKGGIAAGLAHNHFIAATKYDTVIDFEVTAPGKSTFTFETATNDLDADNFSIADKWSERLKTLKIVDESFQKLSDDDRKTIRENMLSDGQLDPKRFPKINAKIKNLQAVPKSADPLSPTHSAVVSVTIQGKTIERTLPAVVVNNNNSLAVESLGAFKFSEFGVEPYSALLGAIKNNDEFHIYVNFKAVE